MIIDAILDRKDGIEYDAEKFYRYVSNGVFDFCVDIARALDCGTNKDVQDALCTYIDEQGYNPEIKKYITSVEWV